VTPSAVSRAAYIIILDSHSRTSFKLTLHTSMDDSELVDVSFAGCSSCAESVFSSLRFLNWGTSDSAY